MKSELTDTDRKFCSILFDVISAHGVEDVVCSPGSRNAPLLIAAASRPNLRKHVVIDERSAAFMALGMALSSNRPVALVCTSGTALLNYSPAVAEAYYQGVPLIVISADRPEQWIDQDDSQTIRQYESMSNFVKTSCQLPAWGNEDVELQWYVNRIVNDAMIQALSPRRGPVHVNVRLGEPLGQKSFRCGRNPRIIDKISADYVANRDVVKRLATDLKGKKVMFVAGFMPPDARFHKSAKQFASLPNVVTMAETISNLHIKGSSEIDSVLTAFSDETLDKMCPDVVLSVGGSLVSRKLKEYLRRNKGRCSHWSLGWGHTTSDCFQCLTKRVEFDPARLLHQLYCVLNSEGLYSSNCEANDYRLKWEEMRHTAQRIKSDFAWSAGWSELMAFGIILGKLPHNVTLFLSNGTSVRYAQLFPENIPHASFCNRGVSGIDGSTSTAIGYAIESGKPTWLITGDMSMSYDIGALSLKEIPNGMKIIVIDNSGGGIFRFIPTTSSLEEREEYFCASPVLPLRLLAEAYGWEYWEAAGPEELTVSFEGFVRSPNKSIMKINCDGEKSAGILRRYMLASTVNSPSHG